jgi:hypothetical protein
MKRRIFTGGMLALVMGVAGCSEPEGGAAREAASEPGPGSDRAGSWVTPPTIDSVERSPSSLMVRGHAAPLGRVVLRGAGETAYAAGADDRGRVELRIQPPTADTLFVVETRDGQDTAPAPQRLLVSRDPAGPVALLAAGTPTRRLDRAGALDVIDSDGRALLASGRAAPGAMVSVAVGGGAATEALTADDGRWSLMLAAAGGAAVDVTVAGRTYRYPGPGLAPTEGFLLEAVEGGWRASWRLSPGSRQSSWFPVG